MLSLSVNNLADVISRYLDDFLIIDNSYCEQMVGQIYPTEFQLNKANSFDPEAHFLDFGCLSGPDFFCSGIQFYLLLSPYLYLISLLYTSRKF